MQYRVLRALMIMFATHAPPCSGCFDPCGKTPLKSAICFGGHDVAAFLRSVGAPE
jgi:hypothetical protein